MRNIWRTLGYLVAAGLIALAAVIIVLSDATVPDAQSAPQGKQAKHDAQPPTPAPQPKPLPQGEDYYSARARSEVTGRPLVVLFGATWCAPCQKVHQELLPALRAKGEFAYVDIDADRALYEHSCRGWPVPVLIVYNRTGNTWSLAGSCVGYDDIKIYANQVGAVPALQAPDWNPWKPRLFRRASVDTQLSSPIAVASAECCPGGNCQQPGDNGNIVFRGRLR